MTCPSSSSDHVWFSLIFLEWGAMASPDIYVPSRYSPDSDSSDLDQPFTHLKTPNLDFPLTGGDIAEELSWQDVLIEIAGDQMMIQCVNMCDQVTYLCDHQVTSWWPTAPS